MKEGLEDEDGPAAIGLPVRGLDEDSSWAASKYLYQLIIHISCNRYMKSLKTQVGVRGVPRVALLPSVCLSGDWRKRGPYLLAPLFIVRGKRVSINGYKGILKVRLSYV